MYRGTAATGGSAGWNAGGVAGLAGLWANAPRYDSGLGEGMDALGAPPGAQGYIYQFAAGSCIATRNSQEIRFLRFRGAIHGVVHIYKHRLDRLGGRGVHGPPPSVSEAVNASRRQGARGAKDSGRGRAATDFAVGVEGITGDGGAHLEGV